MKKVLIFVTIIVLVYSCNNKPADSEDSDSKNLTTINGKIENARDKQIILTYNLTSDTLQLNDNGEFSAKIVIGKATHIILINGINHARIYINPRTNLSFTANAENFFKTITFTGDDASVNNYLALQVKVVAEAGINSINFLYASDIEVFENALNNFDNTLIKNLEAFEKNSKNKYADFISLERERLRITKATLLLSYYTPLINTNQINVQLEEQIDDLVAATDLNNPKMIYLYEFKPFVQNYTAYKLNQELKADKREFKSAKEYAELYFNVLKETFVEPVVLEEVYYSFLKDFISYYGAESVSEVYSDYKDITSNKQRLTELDRIFAEYNQLAPGQASIDWSFPDINGKTYTLSQFRGKYIYIDVWASWCGPCKKELPYLKSIKEKFADKNIEIIGISLDENRADWENAIKNESLTGIQLFAGGWENELCEFFKITGIPRFILLDKQGKIINANADRPSGDIETVLNNLEGI
jgi:thiol-disulfide isomerase/thioredoxin